MWFFTRGKLGALLIVTSLGSCGPETIRVVSTPRSGQAPLPTAAPGTLSKVENTLARLKASPQLSAAASRIDSALSRSRIPLTEGAADIVVAILENLLAHPTSSNDVASALETITQLAAPEAVTELLDVIRGNPEASAQVTALADALRPLSAGEQAPFAMAFSRTPAQRDLVLELSTAAKTLSRDGAQSLGALPLQMRTLVEAAPTNADATSELLRIGFSMASPTAASSFLQAISARGQTPATLAEDGRLVASLLASEQEILARGLAATQQNALAQEAASRVIHAYAQKPAASSDRATLLEMVGNMLQADKGAQANAWMQTIAGEIVLAGIDAPGIGVRDFWISESEALQARLTWNAYAGASRYGIVIATSEGAEACQLASTTALEMNLGSSGPCSAVNFANGTRWQGKPSAFDANGLLISKENQVFEFRVDRLSPSLGASAKTGNTGITVSISDAGSGLDSSQCRIDEAAQLPCTTEYLVGTLDAGMHLLEIRSRDRAGNALTRHAPLAKGAIVGTDTTRAIEVKGGNDTVWDGMLRDSAAPSIRWSAIDGAVGYEVAVAPQSALGWVCPPAVTAETQVTLTGCALQDRTNYRVFVWGLGASGEILNRSSMGAPLFTAFVNTPPTVANISKNGPKGSDVVLSRSDFAAATTDAEGDAIAKIRIESLPGSGSLHKNGAPLASGAIVDAADLDALLYRPNDPDMVATDSFAWSGYDGAAWSNSSASVSIAFRDGNDAPEVTTVSKVASEDLPATFSLSDFQAGFSDLNGDSLVRILVVTLPGSGTLTLSGVNVTAGQAIDAAQIGNLRYLGNPNYNNTVASPDSFTWKANDGGNVLGTSDPLWSNAASVNIRVLPVNDVPVIANVDLNTNEDTDLTIASANFDSSFSDIDGDVLTKIKVLNLPANGTLLLGSTPVSANQEVVSAQIGNLRFVPAANWFGNTSFSWNGFDGIDWATTTRLVRISVASVNDVPVVATFSLTASEDLPLAFQSSDFTSKFSDPDTGDSMAVLKIVTLPANGSIKKSGSAVSAGQEIPTAEIGQLAYHPNADTHGTDSFSWTASDGTAFAPLNALVSLTIQPVNDKPVLQNVSKTIAEDAFFTFAEADFTGAYSDVDGDTLKKVKITSLPHPTKGVLTLGGAAVTLNQEIAANLLGTLRYTPNANFNGADAFTWNGFDGATYATVDASVLMTVTPVDDLPVVSNFTKTGAEDSDVTFTSTDFTSRYTDVESQPLLSITIVTLPSNGTLKKGATPVVAADTMGEAELSQLVFSPNANWNGTTNFTWKATNAGGTSAAAATVTLTVTPVNDSPTVAGFSKSTAEDTVLSFALSDFSSKFTDVDGETLQEIKILTLPEETSGTLRLGGTAVTTGQTIASASIGTLTFAPASNFNGDASFTWTGRDATVFAGSGATVSITITAVNDPPTVSAFSKSTAEDTTLTFAQADFTTKFADVDTGNSLVNVKITVLPTSGALKVGSTTLTANAIVALGDLGNLVYVPNANFAGTDGFSWTASDGTAYATVAASTSLTVTPVNDLPVLSDGSATTPENTPITFTTLAFSVRFSEVDQADALSKVRIGALPTKGLLRLSGVAVQAGDEIAAASLANLTYTPDRFYVGSDSFTWNAADGAAAYALADAAFNLTVSYARYDVFEVIIAAFEPTESETLSLWASGLESWNVTASDGATLTTGIVPIITY